MATASSASSKIERAHQLYREGNHGDALDLYTEALAMAKTKAQKIALHSNRAACYLKLHDFKMAAKECTSVLELDHQHTGALMLRAQTLVTLKDYQSALFDVNRLIELNPSSDVYRNLHSRLKTQLALAPIPESDEETQCVEEQEEEQGQEEEQKEAKQEQKEERNEEMITHKKGNRMDEPSSINPKSPTTQNQNLESPPNLHSKSPPTVHSKAPPGVHSKAWETIPKPKGHSGLDYSRWDRVEDDSSEEEDDDDEEQQPQYRFRVRTVGVRSVK
ncbi:uncharacterized protein A4U43_C06F850 [Asparagus officinalis]|uniref:Uncharacterized protein n=1 Tax=Asparagus officinalis TaxID=4686 RepID=A0A5P1EIJ3_ASPOF|nr:protein unc-45 homolog A [Asparagus officinalis]ONK65775.1 uncharacterized protein A4U43_C06F850 [Asparagus officinalis]